MYKLKGFRSALDWHSDEHLLVVVLDADCSVRNGPGQPEGFQAGFEAAGPGR